MKEYWIRDLPIYRGFRTLYYDVRNRQISYLNGATTNFVWADGNLVHEYTNTSTKTYFYAIILAGDSAGQAYLYNTHGDVIKLIGTLTWNYQYDAYGVQQNPDPLDGNAFRYDEEKLEMLDDVLYIIMAYNEEHQAWSVYYRYNGMEGRYIADDGTMYFSSFEKIDYYKMIGG